MNTAAPSAERTDNDTRIFIRYLLNAGGDPRYRRWHLRQNGDEFVVDAVQIYTPVETYFDNVGTLLRTQFATTGTVHIIDNWAEIRERTFAKAPSMQTRGPQKKSHWLTYHQDNQLLVSNIKVSNDKYVLEGGLALTWSLIDGLTSEAEVVARVAAQLNLALEDAQDGVNDALKNFRENGLIESAPAEDTPLAQIMHGSFSLYIQNPKKADAIYSLWGVERKSDLVVAPELRTFVPVRCTTDLIDGEYGGRAECSGQVYKSGPIAWVI